MPISFFSDHYGHSIIADTLHIKLSKTWYHTQFSPYAKSNNCNVYSFEYTHLKRAVNTFHSISFANNIVHKI